MKLDEIAAAGWKMVPIEPTIRMISVGLDAYIDSHDRIGIASAWDAMLAVSPSVAALTVSNARVAELERERDEAIVRAAAMEDRAEAAEAEVSRLKAGAVTDEMAQKFHDAAKSWWDTQPDDIEVTDDHILQAIRAGLEVVAVSVPTRVGRFRIEHDGFVGDAIGSYTRRDGKRGVVLQQRGTNVCRLYSEKLLMPVDALPSQAGASR